MSVGGMAINILNDMAAARSIMLVRRTCRTNDFNS